MVRSRWGIGSKVRRMTSFPNPLAFMMFLLPSQSLWQSAPLVNQPAASVGMEMRVIGGAYGHKLVTQPCHRLINYSLWFSSRYFQHVTVTSNSPHFLAFHVVKQVASVDTLLLV